MEALEALINTSQCIVLMRHVMPEQELIDKVMEAGLYAASGKKYADRLSS